MVSGMAETTTPTPVENLPSAVPPKPDPEIAQMRAKLAEYEAKDAAAQAEAAKAAEAERERLKRSGDVEKLLEAQNADLAALRAKNAEYERTAPEAQALIARETARVEALKAKLSDSQKALVDKMPTLALKAEAIDELLTNAQAGGVPFKMPPTIGGGPPPPPAGKVDISALVNEPGGLEKAKRDHPVEWEAWRSAQAKPPAATGAAKFFQFGKKQPPNVV